jgi:hypothetical protein
MPAIGYLGAAWGTAGVVGLLSFAIYRLTPKALEAFQGGLTAGQWWITAAVCIFMAYAEGYRGFQLRFSPRTAARIRYLRDRPNGLHTLVAPLFSMGFIHATRRTKIIAYSLTLGIILLVTLVHRLAQPWRGIVDAGVVVGLTWGLLSLICFVALALSRRSFDHSPQVPQTAPDELELRVQRQVAE